MLGEEPQEPPRYPHLVHKPGTYTQELYLKACKRFQIPRSSLFYKSLLLDTIVMKRQRLGPIGMKACAIALVVGHFKCYYFDEILTFPVTTFHLLQLI